MWPIHIPVVDRSRFVDRQYADTSRSAMLGSSPWQFIAFGTCLTFLATFSLGGLGVYCSVEFKNP